MNKDKDLKIRISDKDIENLNFCQKQLNISKSKIVRLAIEKLSNEIKQERGMKNMKNRIYIEEVKREETGYHAMNVWNREELVEIIQHQLDANNEDERVAIAEKMVEKIDAGESVTLGKVFVSEYRIGTSEDIEEANKEMNAFNAELDAMPMPDLEELTKLTAEYKKNHK